LLNRTADRVIPGNDTGIMTTLRTRMKYIASTFFYRPDADEVMPIRVGGVDVVFTTKDGKIADRRPGSELAQQLAIPGWLATADNVYYVVSSTVDSARPEARRSGTSVDTLAIHLIIEKDDKVYNTSLRAIDQALKDTLDRDHAYVRSQLTSVGIVPEEVDEIMAEYEADRTRQIDQLRMLRYDIVRAYAPDFTQTGILPTTAAKNVKPTGLRTSNGRFNPQRRVNEQGVTVPVFRKLTEVADLQMPSDPAELTRQIENGDVKLGIGRGPMADTVRQMKITSLNDVDDIWEVGVGYAGKVYLQLKPEQTPSRNNEKVAPIMLSEQLMRVDGVASPQDYPIAYRFQKNNGGYLMPVRIKDGNGRSLVPTLAEQFAVECLFYNNK
jgi:hypothetical protein